MANDELRQRLLSPDQTETNLKWDPDNLPLKSKLKLARKAKDDPLYVYVLEGLMIVFTIVAALYCWFYFDNVHFHVSHAYAHLGYDVAQHHVGQRYLHGKGVEKHPEKAMEWFRKAADQGHPHAAYNLAIGHLKGYKTDLKPGESHQLITHAAANGVKEAHHVLNSVCTKGGIILVVGCSNLENIIIGSQRIKSQEIDETIRRIQTHKGVMGVIIVNNNGVPLKSTLDNTTTVQYASQIHGLAAKARSVIKEMDSTNDLRFLRVRSKKHEILVAPEQDYSMIVIQKDVY